MIKIMQLTITFNGVYANDIDCIEYNYMFYLKKCLYYEDIGMELSDSDKADNGVGLRLCS